MPELPHLAPIARPEPDPAALKELDLTLERLTSDDERARANAAGTIGDARASSVAAIRQRVQELRGSLDRDAAARLLEEARKAGRKKLRAEGGDVKKKPKTRGKDETDEDGDWLEFTLAAAHPKDKTWRELAGLLAMERMLGAVGTTPAVRLLVELYAYFGDLVRVDVQRQVMRLKDKAVPALIEARQHDAKIIQRWANKQLDALGRAIPGEAVGTGDTQVLADVLRAYGRTRDVDAVRVILSFCNSDRVQLREAARESVAAIGEPAMWQLRDVFLGLTGQKPPREWSWDRLARELFALHDRARLAEVYKLMDDGMAAASASKYADATAAFDKVLARSPLFERRKEMVSAYVSRAKELEPQSRDDALAMLRKALRLDPKAEGVKKLEGEIAYLEGALSIERGAPDKFILERALELDPTNERARRALATLGDPAIARRTSVERYLAAIGVGLVALVGMLLLARRRREPPAPPDEVPPLSAPPD